MISKEHAIFCMQACINSYHGRWGEVKEIFDTEECQFAVNNTQGFFAKKDETLYVVFQGSVGIMDWVNNFQRSLIPNRLPNAGKTHKGFTKQYVDVTTLIFERVFKHDYEKIVVVGNSLGAAIATICSMSLIHIFEYRHDLDLTCVTYGSPKVGNKEFADYYNKAVPNNYRFVNNNDIVTRIPAFGYTHVGKEIRLTNNPRNPLRSHDPKQYLKSLEITDEKVFSV